MSTGEKRTSRFDTEDWLYLVGAVAVSAGCAWIYAPAGLLSLGAFAALPPMVSLFRKPKGPQQ